jgi:hypothetical protein
MIPCLVSDSQLRAMVSRFVGFMALSCKSAASFALLGFSTATVIPWIVATS